MEKQVGPRRPNPGKLSKQTDFAIQIGTRRRNNRFQLQCACHQLQVYLLSY